MGYCIDPPAGASYTALHITIRVGERLAENRTMSEIPVTQGPPQESPRPRKVVERPRILLVRPPQLFYFGVWPRGPRLSVPTGILAIGSYLKRNGLDVQIYDCFVEGDSFRGDELAASIAESARGLNRRWVRQFE